ncbi:MAG TPA: NAD-dependent epimerase/dehydratase family protein [Dehalococcoidia bacterium]|nr:NAD-dependent epimerase/dehydratase family protein [Dehalococcoidia bacterium]
MSRRVLVTGGAGFIGSHIVEALLAQGWEVEVLDDLSAGCPANLPPGVPLHRGDVCSPGDLGCLTARFEAVVHCAGQTSVGLSVRRPDLDWQVNVLGTANLVLWAAARGVGRFVFLSSGGAVYGETPRPAREACRPRPLSPYGRHKLLGEMLVRASGLPYAVLRPSNVYGPRQRAGAEGGVVAIFLQRMLSGHELEVYGDGLQERDFVHAADVAAAAALAVRWPQDVVWNVATGRAMTMLGLACLLGQVLGARPRLRFLPPRPGDVRRSVLDPSCLLSTGRWGPPLALEEGLQRLAAALGRSSALMLQAMAAPKIT